MQFPEVGIAWQLLRVFKHAILFCSSPRNEASQTQLINHCKAVAEQISSLVQAVRMSISNPDNPSAQLGLINSSQAMIPVSVEWEGGKEGDGRISLSNPSADSSNFHGLLFW